MFNSWYSFHLCKGQGLWWRFTNEERWTWSAAVSDRLVNVNYSRWCILHPEFKKKPLYMKWNEFYLEETDHHHANCCKLAFETVQPFSAYWCHSKWLLVFFFFFWHLWTYKTKRVCAKGLSINLVPRDMSWDQWRLCEIEVNYVLWFI